MITHAEYDVRLPDYSICYLINGDSSGLDESDILTIDNCMKRFYDIADSVNGSLIISVMDSDDNQESYFSSSPLFGFPCHVYDAKIIILVENSLPISQDKEYQKKFNYWH